MLVGLWSGKVADLFRKDFGSCARSEDPGEETDSLSWSELLRDFVGEAGKGAVVGVRLSQSIVSGIFVGDIIGGVLSVSESIGRGRNCDIVVYSRILLREMSDEPWYGSQDIWLTIRSKVKNCIEPLYIGTHTDRVLKPVLARLGVGQSQILHVWVSLLCGIVLGVREAHCRIVAETAFA